LGEDFADALGCDTDDLNCFLNKNSNQILNAQESVSNDFSLLKPLESFMPWGPIINDDIPYQTLDCFAKGLYNHVPLIIGSVSEEAVMFVYAALSSPLSYVKYSAALADIFLLDSPDVFDEYTPQLIGDKRDLLAELGTDFIFLAPSRYASLLIASQQNEPVYLYQFNHSISFNAWGKNFSFCVGRVCHGSELPFEFHQTGGFQFTSQENILSYAIIDYFTNFAAFSNPNQGAEVLVEWPPISTSDVPYLILQTDEEGGMQIEDDIRLEETLFWQKLGFHFGW